MMSDKEIVSALFVLVRCLKEKTQCNHYAKQSYDGNLVGSSVWARVGLSNDDK